MSSWVEGVVPGSVDTLFDRNVEVHNIGVCGLAYCNVCESLVMC